MARETRTSNRDTTSTSSTTPGKRKRLNSTTPVPSVPATNTKGTLKVVLPPPSSLATGTSTHVSENDTGNATKKQKMTITIKNPNASKSDVQVEDEVVNQQEGEARLDEEEQGEVLSPELRNALAIVISQMAVNLPDPLNGILTLWLPPDFEQKKENTLGHILEQKDLTWEKLVDILHLFAENLLVPCSYPNPMPSLAQFHQPIPPLPSHYRPHVIYNFCATLRALMLRTEPESRSRLDPQTAEKWALVQKLPGAMNGTSNAGEWFSSVVDPRMTEITLASLKKEDENVNSVLEKFASTGDKFGMASPVSIQVLGSAKADKVVTLSETLIRRASLKASRWKELKAAKKGGFGSVSRGVQSVQLGATTWTPSFAPTYDSSRATGGGSYYGHLDAMRERLSCNEWRRESADLSSLPEVERGWKGIEEEAEIGESSKVKECKERDIDEVLRENAELLNELSAWQEVRVRKGIDKVEPSTREHAIADALFASLTDLVGAVKPAHLIPSQKEVGYAHELSQRFIPASSPSIRGTIDSRRPQAIRDNVTVKPRPVTQPHAGISAALAGGIPSPSQSAPSPYNSQAQPTPPRNYNYNASQTSAYSTPGQTTYRPPATTYSAYGSTPNAGNTVYSRTGPATAMTNPAQAQYARPGPGPSNLRQSYAPGVGSPYGRNPAAGLMSQIGGQYRL